MEAFPYLKKLTVKREEIEDSETYPFSIPAVANLESLEFNSEVTFLIGENGSGKSTLIEAIAVALGFNPEGGTKNFSFETHSSHSPLHEYIRLTKSYVKPKDGFFLRAESFFNVASNIEEMDKTPPDGTDKCTKSN